MRLASAQAAGSSESATGGLGESKINRQSTESAALEFIYRKLGSQ